MRKLYQVENSDCEPEGWFTLGLFNSKEEAEDFIKESKAKDKGWDYTYVIAEWTERDGLWFGGRNV